MIITIITCWQKCDLFGSVLNVLHLPIKYFFDEILFPFLCEPLFPSFLGVLILLRNCVFVGTRSVGYLNQPKIYTCACREKQRSKSENMRANSYGRLQHFHVIISVHLLQMVGYDTAYHHHVHDVLGVFPVP